MESEHAINVAAILRSEEAGGCLAKQSSQLPGINVTAFEGDITSVTPGGSIVSNADLIVVDVDPGDPEKVAMLAELVTALKPNTLVAATAMNISIADVRSLMRAGVVDVLPQPISIEDLKSATRHVNGAKVFHEAEQARKRGSVVTFMNCGGGSGATTLAVQSGYILAARSDADKPDTCIVDLDVQLGSAALYMDVGTQLSVADLLGEPGRLDASLLDSTVGHHVSGVDVLAAPNSAISLDRLTPEFIDNCLGLVRNQYKYNLIDIPNAWTPWTYQVLKNSDLIILVMQLTVAGVRRAKRQVETLRDSGLGQIPVRLVVNRVEKRGLRRIRLKEAEKAIGRSIDHSIPDEYETVVDAGNQGVALSKVRMKTKVGSGIAAMVDDMIAEITAQREIRL